MGRFDLVIFDCDGVLVDGERLAIRVEAEILTGLGWSLTESDIVEGFVGRSAAYMHQEIERHLGRSASSASAKSSNSMYRWKHAAVTTEWAQFTLIHRGCATTVLWVEPPRGAAGTVPAAGAVARPLLPGHGGGLSRGGDPAAGRVEDQADDGADDGEV